MATAAAVGWAVTRAGLGDGVVNTGGWGAFGRFWAAVASPEAGLEFLTLTAEAALVTLSFAVLGTALGTLTGAAASLALSSLVTRSSRRGAALRRLARVVLAVPRGVHEILWALLIIQILGFDPLVAVLAIAIPSGAVMAKVFAEAIDSADPGPYHALRASGAPRLAALTYGVLPTMRGELVSYGFYRFECAIRSAAVLGVIGAGGLGFQLDLSFETLRYHEIWTLIAALMLLSGLADFWSTSVRARAGGVGRWSVGAALALVPLAWWWVDVDPRTLWSGRSRSLALDVGADLVPPRLGPGGWGELGAAALDTVAMSILALVIAVGGGLVLASMGPAGGLWAVLSRAVLLLFRAVPAPVWAFLFVLILFPGTWPGAVALGVYNLGVLGRLFAEAIEERDRAPARAVARLGAGRLATFAYAVAPTAGPRLAALALYRWEVMLRETVVVGVVGAGGLGQLISEHLAARDLAAVVGAVIVLVILATIIDIISARVRPVLA